MTALTAAAGTNTTTPTWASASRAPHVPRARRSPRQLLTAPMLVRLDLTASAVEMEVTLPEPAWFYGTLSRLQQLSQLMENWDSYGGRRPHDDAMVTALGLLARLLRHDSAPPVIVPTSEGGVQLEWHQAGRELEVRVGPTAEISAFRFDEAAGQGATLDHISLSDLAPLVTLAGRL
jgi:hypothetical protein